MTGEHTCMVLKPLTNDDVGASGSDKWGFLGPFFQGVPIFPKNAQVIFHVCLTIFLFNSFSHLESLMFAVFRLKFIWKLSAYFRAMEYKLAMR